jgi:uncharacterized membrane protein YjjB (DUF3815 family)
MKLTEFLLAFGGSFCAGLLFNIKGSKLLWAGLSGMAGWIAYAFVVTHTGQLFFSVFTGAIAVGVFSEVMARILKNPATVFSIPGIFPLVPGIAAYETIQYLLSDRLQEAGSKMVETLAAAGAIAFGILLVTALFKLAFSKKQA